MTFDAVDDAELHPLLPPLAPDDVTAFGVVRRLGINTLAAFPARCFDEPVIRMDLLGRSFVIVCSPQATRHVLSGDAPYRRFGAAITAPLVGRGLSVSAGDAWRRQRRTLAPAFTPRSIAELSPLIMRLVGEHVARIEAVPGNALDLFGALQRLGLDVAFTLVFSRGAEGFGPQVARRVDRYLQQLGPAMSDLLLPAYLPTPRTLRRAMFRRDWTRLMRAIIAARRAAPRDGAGVDLFEMLKDAYAGDDDLLLDEIATIITAGHETTVLSMFWALQLLAQSPRWQTAVAAEANQVDLSPGRAAEAVPRLPLTRAVLEEAMRLYPPVPINGRQATQADVLDGVAIPPGALVLMPAHMLHRNSASWTSPALFDPGRFLAAKVDRSAYLPFGAGPHVCIGAQLALTEATLVLARLLRGNSLSLADSGPALAIGGVTTRPDRGPMFRLAPR